MALPLTPPIEPMLALPQDDIPSGEGWVYEPKWDGFRAVVFKDGGDVYLNSRKGQPLQRYFPELVETFRARLPERCIVDGEIILAGKRGLEFDTLQLRLHPAASRVNKLAKEMPASFVAFDLLALGEEDLRGAPFRERRRKLESLVQSDAALFLTPQTLNHEEAARWFARFEGAGLDGVIAKRADGPYTPGERTMVKVKHARTADCVVGGYREAKGGGAVGSLLLGLYDEGGVLHHVGHTSSFKAKEKKELLAKLRPLEGKKSFGEGRTPGAPSRWSSGKELAWTAVEPTLVCEVAFDYMQGDRFRHGATFLRWREDKAPRACTYDQLAPPNPFSLQAIIELSARGR
ncbi:MAG: ATP-dependent DNA ligase [Myxococcota bacterium]